MIRVYSVWNLLYACMSADIVFYDALLFQFLGICYGFHSTLCRMRSCCFQGSGPDSQHNAPCSTDSPDIHSTRLTQLSLIAKVLLAYVALMLLCASRWCRTFSPYSTSEAIGSRSKYSCLILTAIKLVY